MRHQLGRLARTVSNTLARSPSDTVLLLHFDGPNNSTTIVDSSPNPKVATVGGDAKISTVSSKFGGAALTAGTGGFVRFASHPDFGFGLGDFFIGLQVNATNINQDTRMIVDCRTTGIQAVPTLYMAGGRYSYYVNGANQITGPSVQTGFQNLCLSRVNLTTRMFVEGKIVSSFTDNTNYIQCPFNLMNHIPGGFSFFGYLDEVYVLKGVGVATEFTPPTAPYTE